MPPVEVRPATPVEALAISRLLAEAIRDSYTGILEEPTVEHLVSTNCSLTRIKAEIGIPGGVPGWLGWLVAIDTEGTVVGVAAGGVPTAGEGEVYSLCASPALRGTGIGTALLTAVTERIREHDAKRQAVSLHSEQDPARGFFVRQGFTGSGTRLLRGL
ncbi:GNAT family N-acetyltransferase [Streptomyces sp. NPDC102274]|uniref:GNAT family N-acetyltransferase n=1 Tax=Streptomyces sp. NPDC102274 TaxID=3366151 RepID=UPI003822A625